MSRSHNNAIQCNAMHMLNDTPRSTFPFTQTTNKVPRLRSSIDFTVCSSATKALPDHAARQGGNTFLFPTPEQTTADATTEHVSNTCIHASMHPCMHSTIRPYETKTKQVPRQWRPSSSCSAVRRPVREVNIHFCEMSHCQAGKALD